MLFLQHRQLNRQKIKVNYKKLSREGSGIMYSEKYYLLAGELKPFQRTL